MMLCCSCRYKTEKPVYHSLEMDEVKGSLVLEVEGLCPYCLRTVYHALHGFLHSYDLEPKDAHAKLYAAVAESTRQLRELQELQQQLNPSKAEPFGIATEDSQPQPDGSHSVKVQIDAPQRGREFI